jgi:hypothetical protein
VFLKASGWLGNIKLNPVILNRKHIIIFMWPFKKEVWIPYELLDEYLDEIEFEG